MTRLMSFASVSILSASILTPAVSAQSAPAAQPFRVEPIENGFVVAPDARFTEVNGEFATLAGVYGGWLTDRTLLIGGGGYWLANRDDDFKMQYFGGVVRWNIGGHRRLGVSTGALIGVGDATLARSYGDLFGAAPVGDTSSRFRGGRGSQGFGRVVTSDTLVRIDDDFFIAEPQVNALWNITRWMRLDAGVGYRIIGASDLLGDELRGVSGSIALQFGGR